MRRVLAYLGRERNWATDIERGTRVGYQLPWVLVAALLERTLRAQLDRRAARPGTQVLYQPRPLA